MPEHCRKITYMTGHFNSRRMSHNWNGSKGSGTSGRKGNERHHNISGKP